jgi:DNA mismatch repair protein MSH5
MPSSKRQRGQASPSSNNRPKSRLPPSRQSQGTSRSQQSLPQDSTPLSAPHFSVPQSRATQPNATVVSPEGANQLPEQSEDEEVDQIIMAIDMKEKQTIGCCYYVAQEEKLYLLEDVQSGGLEIIEKCMKFIPTCLVCGR